MLLFAAIAVFAIKRLPTILTAQTKRAFADMATLLKFFTFQDIDVKYARFYNFDERLRIISEDKNHLYLETGDMCGGVRNLKIKKDSDFLKPVGPGIKINPLFIQPADATQKFKLLSIRNFSSRCRVAKKSPDIVRLVFDGDCEIKEIELSLYLLDKRMGLTLITD